MSGKVKLDRSDWGKIQFGAGAPSASTPGNIYINSSTGIMYFRRSLSSSWEILSADLSNVTYIGTTSVALNRTSAPLTLTGITLTTPDIGTPSAGVLTNCTGLPVAGLANGTDGELITWSAAGVATTVDAGTATQILTSNGPGAAPTFQTPAVPVTSIDGLSDGSTTGTENVYLGTNAGPLGEYNTGVGYNALNIVEATGTYNSAFGNYALGNVSTGDYNIGVGINAGFVITQGSNNIAIGKDSIGVGSSTSGFADNIAIGRVSMGGGGAKSSTNNIAIGTSTLSALTGGNYNIAMGFETGLALTSGTLNVLLGTWAGKAITTGDYNVAIGYNALLTAGLSSKHNVCLGMNTGGYMASISSNNTFVGNSAGGTSATGAKLRCVYIGNFAGDNAVFAGTNDELVIANSNTATPLIYGVFPNTSLTFTASDVILTGALTVPVYTPGTTTNKLYNVGGDLYFNGSSVNVIGVTSIDDLSDASTTGTRNTFLGSSSGPLGEYNTGVGYMSLGAVEATGVNNNAFGYRALGSLTTGDDNIGIGMDAGYSIVLGSNNTVIGSGGVYGGTTTATFDENIAIGTISMAGAGAKSGNDNIGIGYSTLSTLTSGYGNVGVGRYSLSSITEGDDNVAVGGFALENVTTSSSNVGIGPSAGMDISLGDYNIAMGYAALGYDPSYGASTTVTFTDNIAIGSSAMAGASAKSGNDNIGIGTEVLSVLTSGTYNVGIGNLSLYALTTGYDNTCIGEEAGYGIVTGSYNITIGYETAYEASDSDFQNNIAIGTYALYNGGSGFDNVAIGNSVLETITTGYENVGVGSCALEYITTGNSNIGIGYDAGYAIEEGSQNIIIGYDSVEDGSTTSAFENNITIGTESMNGNVARSGTDNIAIGQSALYSVAAGIDNTCIGSGSAGTAAVNVVSANVCIGHDSGNNTSLTSNQLWIANSNTTTPLIYGVFPNTSLTFTATDVICSADLTVGQYNVTAMNSAPSSASDTGTLGEIRIVANAIYVCTATDTWVKADLTTW